MSTKEIVTIAGGVGGIQLSSAMWELFCEEYGIDADGQRSTGVAIPDLPINSFFEVTERQIFPRTVMIYPNGDLSFLTNYDRTWNEKLYRLDSKIALKNNYNEKCFIQGYYLDQDGLERTLDRIRVMCEECSSLDGFIICRQYFEHINGFISKLLEELDTNYGRKTKIDYAKVPSPNSLNNHNRMAVLNTFFTISDCIEKMDCCIIADDFAMTKIYTEYEKLQRGTRDIYYIRCMCNRILAQAFSGITSPLRFRSENWSLDNYKVLVPYKEIPFVTMAYAPLVLPEQSIYNRSIKEITNECLGDANKMLWYKPREGAYISSLLVYRGSEVSQTDIVDTLADINRRCKQGIDFRRANGIENPFQAKFVRTEATALRGGCIVRPRKLVASCSNNTDLYNYWKKLAANVEDTLRDQPQTHDPEEQSSTLEQLKSCYTYIKNTYRVERDHKEDLKHVNENLLKMLDRYADFDCNIQHDRRTAGFMSS